MDGSCPVPENSASGRVHVFARVRPPSASDPVTGHAVEVDADAGVVHVRNEADAVDRMLTGLSADAALHATEPKHFPFDSVFSPTASQRDVFLRVGLPVLRECMNGFNGTILAYGQTGSGKTYSLLHQDPKSQEIGLLPRLIASLFLQIAHESSNSVFTVEAAVLQVYNEQVDDLLHPEHQSGAGHNLQVQNAGCVPGLTWLACQRPEPMIEAFTRARANLIYAETKMNKASSRSHAVFQIHITKRNRASSAPVCGSRKIECVHSRLTVVDLAGSERVKKSGVEGTQFKEATAINKSLLAFGNVVSALAVKKSHVPLRDSKLTRILDGSIGGNCKTALLVCASPLAEHVPETLNTFDFASRAMRVEVNAKVNTSIIEVNAKTLLSDLNEDAEGLGMPLLAKELHAMTKKCSDVAEKAKSEAEKQAKTLKEARNQSYQMRKKMEVAESRETALRDEAQSLRQDQANVQTEIESVRNALSAAENQAASWRETAERCKTEAQDLRTKISINERSAKEGGQAGDGQVVESTKRQHDEFIRVRREADTIAKQATARYEQAAARCGQVQHQLKDAEERASTAERQASDAQQRALNAERRAVDAETSLTISQEKIRILEENLDRVRGEIAQAQAEVRQISEQEQKMDCETLQEALADAQLLRSRAHELEGLNAELRLSCEAHVKALAQLNSELEEAKIALCELQEHAHERERHFEQNWSNELAAEKLRSTSAINELNLQLSTVQAEALAGSATAQQRHLEEVDVLESQMAAQAAKSNEDVSRLLEQTTAVLEEQRKDAEYRLENGKKLFEIKLAFAQEKADKTREELQSRLDEQEKYIEETIQNVKTDKENALREAWEQGCNQQRRLSSAFKAARAVTEAKEMEIRDAHADLSRRFAGRESREEDVKEIWQQRKALDEHRKLLGHRDKELHGVCLELQNRDETDRIFSRSAFRKSDSWGFAPRMPGQKVGDIRSFSDRGRDVRVRSRTMSSTMPLPLPQSASRSPISVS